MHTSISIKDLEHKPHAGRAVEALRVVKDNVVGVANAESFHRFLKLGFGGKRFQKLSLGSAKLKKVQVLGIGKSSLCVNHDTHKNSHKLILCILFGSNVSCGVENFHRAKTIKYPLC